MGGENFVGTLANGGVALSPFHDLDSQIPAELKAEVDAAAPRTSRRAPSRSPTTSSRRTTFPNAGSSLARPRFTEGGRARIRGSVADPCASSSSDITKRFPGVLANDRISIAADRGEVLGLLGENGAGKSTLMNILSGLYRPDSGEILIDGEARSFTDPARPSTPASGWSTSTSSWSPCSTWSRRSPSGAESVTGFARHVRPHDRPQARRRAVHAVRPQRQPGREDRGPPRRRAPAGGDPQGALPQERHPRARRAVRRPHALRDGGAVRDHPRACRGRHDGHLHHPQAQRGPRGRGHDHRPPPRTRRRDGVPLADHHARSSPTSWSAATSSSRSIRAPANPGDVVLSLEDLYVRDDRMDMAVRGVSLEVRAGEIVALAGVQGNGQTELVEAIVGLRPVDSGEIRIDGESTTTLRPATSRTWASPTCPRTGCATASSRHDGGRELHPRHLSPRAVQPPRGPRPGGHPGRRRGRREGVRRPHAVDRGARRARSRAATSRRWSWPASSPGP